MITPCEETYQDVERMIYRLAWNAVERFGGEWKEYASAGRLGYMKAFDSFDSGRGAFTTHVWHCVVNAITDVRRTKRRDSRIDLLNGSSDKLVAKSGFDLRRFLFELSEDAKVMVGIVVESPGDLGSLLRPTGVKRIRQELCQILKALKWTPARILDCQQEVREALGLTKEDEE